MKLIIGVVLLAVSVFGEEESLENVNLEAQKDESDPNVVAKPKLVPPTWLQPLSDTVSNIISLTQHPNFGGFQFLNPQNLWEKLHEKGVSFLTGPHASVFGTAHNGPLDYPFAYKKKN